MFASIFVFAVLPLTFATVGVENIAFLPHYQNNCLLPPHPEHGRYTVSNYPFATPGERYSSVKLDISCDVGYLNNNTTQSIFCINGGWSAPMPTCVHDMLGYCTLPTDDLKVEYRCLSFPGTLERSWECESLVSARTLVRPICRFPGYFSLKELPEMHCRDGMWDYMPICKPACGLTTQHLQLEGTSTNHLELPWHAVIYSKAYWGYYQICGGSLIAANKIISGFLKPLTSRCFSSDKGGLLPASNFMVAVNKMYSNYDDARDRNRQHSDVIDIKVPSCCGVYDWMFVDNIAIVVVKTPFFFHLSVRPVCLDFDKSLDSAQLTEGNSGKTVRWNGYNYPSSSVLDAVDISYVKIEDCENTFPTKYRQDLTKDKFCAKFNYVRQRDTTNEGSGLAFLDSTTQRYYLRGVYSDYLIPAKGETRFHSYTSIVKHENFIKQHL